MRLLAARDRLAKPWKNGGGLTRDVAVAPPSAGLDDFDWRISFADVASEGPFSIFPAIDRTLVVVDGEGLVLAFGDGDERTLRRGEPFAFPGDAPVASRLLAGPIVDLNVMTRRGALTHRLRRLAGGETWRSAAPRAFLVCAAGDCGVSAAGLALQLSRYDVADVSGVAATIAPAPGAILFSIEIMTGRSLEAPA